MDAQDDIMDAQDDIVWIRSSRLRYATLEDDIFMVEMTICMLRIKSVHG